MREDCAFLAASTLLEWPVAHRYLMCGFLAQSIFRSAVLSIKSGNWGVILRFFSACITVLLIGVESSDLSVHEAAH